MSKTVSIDFISDIVCPWCWVGKRHLDAARALTPKINIDLHWRPFQLDPKLPSKGQPYKEYMAAKFAGKNTEVWQRMRAHLEETAPGLGIEFNFDDIPVRPNTVNAHRLMRWADGQEKADDMAEALFRAFFAESRDIGDLDVLMELAGKIGLDANLVGDLLASDKDTKPVRTEERFYRELGVASVPTFIFNGQFAVAGAESPENLAKAIKEAASKPKIEPG